MRCGGSVVRADSSSTLRLALQTQSSTGTLACSGLLDFQVQHYRHMARSLFRARRGRRTHAHARRQGSIGLWIDRGWSRSRKTTGAASRHQSRDFDLAASVLRLRSQTPRIQGNIARPWVGVQKLSYEIRYVIRSTNCPCHT